jgi:cell division protein FtsX
LQTLFPTFAINNIDLDRNRGFFLHVLNYAWVLFLIGVGMLAWFHCYGLEKKLKENTALAVELKTSQGPAQIQKFKQWLETQPEIIPSTIQRIDTQDIKEMMSLELKSDSLQNGMTGYFPEIFIFKMKQEFLEAEKLKTFSDKLYKQEAVQHFSYQNELTQDLTSTVSRIRLGFLALTVLFVVIGILISEYLAQVFVDSRETVIRNWNELGAVPDKIITPYLKRVVYLSLASACLSVCLIGLIIFLSYYLLPWIYFWIETKKFLLVMLILLIFGPTLQYILVKRKIQSLLN